jgi:hypothetical protein
MAETLTNRIAEDVERYAAKLAKRASRLREEAKSYDPSKWGLGREMNDADRQSLVLSKRLKSQSVATAADAAFFRGIADVLKRAKPSQDSE